MLMNRGIVISSLVGGAIAVLISFIFGGAFFSVIAALLFFLSIVMWKYGYILFPMFSKATNLVEVRDGYEVPPTRDFIMKKAENGYYATKFLEIRFYESSLDKSKEEKHSMFESFEKAISSLKYVVKISLLVSAVDLGKHIDEIKTKRSSAEAKKSKLSGGKGDESVRLDREIAMWNRLLERITHGERPVEVIAFASTTSFGLTKEEAISRIRRQAKEVSTILSSSMGTDIAELSDTEMLKCFEWDRFFPTTQEELRDETF
ncbi:MAG: hypothetical protein AABW86_03215 [Candidatus Micrarchaeota archaeon]